MQGSVSKKAVKRLQLHSYLGIDKRCSWAGLQHTQAWPIYIQAGRGSGSGWAKLGQTKLFITFSYFFYTLSFWGVQTYIQLMQNVFGSQVHFFILCHFWAANTNYSELSRAIWLKKKYTKSFTHPSLLDSLNAKMIH